MEEQILEQMRITLYSQSWERSLDFGLRLAREVPCVDGIQVGRESVTSPVGDAQRERSFPEGSYPSLIDAESVSRGKHTCVV